MEPSMRSRRAVRFGVFEVDFAAGELRKHGVKLNLHGQQPFLVLSILLEHAGQVVTREELSRKLWTGDTFVDFEHSLATAISKIREALGDSAESPRYIETLPRRGYRFIAEVAPLDESIKRRPEPAIRDTHPAEEDKGLRPAGSVRLRKPLSPPVAWKIVGLGFIVVLIGFTMWMFRSWSRQSAGPALSNPVRSLAVLPLESLSGDAAQDYFADGMTDELITDLGQISELRVISRTSVMSYKRVRKPLPQIAHELKVDAIVEGTVLRAGNQVRITAQLIDAAADKHLWANSYVGDLRDTLVLQNHVARDIAEQIRINLTPREQAVLKSAKVVNPEAYEAYLKGRYFWNKRNADSLKTAVDYFSQAIEKDKTYARAYAGLADTYALLGDWQYAVMAPKEALPKAKAAAIKAVELDSTLGEAHTSLAFLLDGFDWDLKSGDNEFRRAIELSPGYATAHHWYAWHLSLLGRNRDAIREMTKAESLDPLSLIISADMAELLLIAHFDDESIEQSRKTIALDPDFALAHNQLGQAYLEKHMYGDAIAELQKAVQLSRRSPSCTANLARAYAGSGRTKDAVQLLNELSRGSHPGHSNAPEIAAIYTALGNKDQAMAWLETGYQERFNPGVLLRPAFDPIRSDPQFKSLVHRLGLPL
jgi:TolB-like protein/DNA-binding winged helix-turn-helix (wHTH) protein/Tfp pilus assembly protein PilF